MLTVSRLRPAEGAKITHDHEYEGVAVEMCDPLLDGERRPVASVLALSAVGEWILHSFIRVLAMHS